MGQKRSDSLTGESKALPENKKVPVTLLCRSFSDDGDECGHCFREFLQAQLAGVLNPNYTLKRCEKGFMFSISVGYGHPLF